MVWHDPDDDQPESATEVFPWERNEFEVPEDTAWRGPTDPNAWQDPLPRVEVDAWWEQDPPPRFIERNSGPLYRMWKAMSDALDDLLRSLHPEVFDDEDQC